jgi:hypothetical protein
VLLVCAVYSTVLYSEIALSRKPFGIGHMYIYTLLLRMTDTVTSQNIDRSSWDTLYVLEDTETSGKQTAETGTCHRVGTSCSTEPGGFPVPQFRQRLSFSGN